jgi:RecA/RadA recombinase
MPAKKTAKKAAKKAAKKTTTKRSESVNIEDPDALPPIVFRRKFDDKSASDIYTRQVSNVRKSIETLANRSKTRPLNMHTPATFRKMLFPYDDIYFQSMLGSVGIRNQSVIEFIAPEAVGKTTFCFDMIGRLAEAGCYTVYIECENKPMDTSRIKRLLSRDKKKATLFLNMVQLVSARQLIECDEIIRRSVADLRKRCDEDPATKGNPIYVFIDTWSSLKSSSEAQGQSTWGLSSTAKKADVKDTGTGSNMGHSKHAQAMKRWLPEFMDTYNASIVFFNHQNVKVDMSGFKSPVMQSEKDNDTTIGGRGLRQIASYRFVMTSAGPVKNKQKKNIGIHVNIKMRKNAYSAPGRSCGMTIFYDDHADTGTEYDDTLTFADKTAEWMAQEKLLGTTVTDGRYTCDTLGCVGVTAKRLYDALKADPANVQFLGSALGIEGYSDTSFVPAARSEDSEDEVDEDEDEEALTEEEQVEGEEEADNE